jgi:hypothetical protein
MQHIASSITYSDVKDSLERQKSRQFKPHRGFNSYVAHEPFEEIKIDIADLTDPNAVNDGYGYVLVATDVFPEFPHAVPIRRKINTI